jgi:hypothetical protein
MKKYRFTLFILVAFLFQSCDTSPAAPEEVLNQFFSALYEKDFSAAAKLATEESKELLILLEYGTRTNPEELNIFNPEQMELGAARINGNTAVVPVKENTTSHSLSYILRKEKNRWRVAFDNFPQVGETPPPASEIGMDAPIDNVMDQLDEINLDSMKNAVKKDLERKERR